MTGDITIDFGDAQDTTLSTNDSGAVVVEQIDEGEHQRVRLSEDVAVRAFRFLLLNAEIGIGGQPDPDHRVDA